MDISANACTVYFIRHAESDFSVKDDVSRPLTESGKTAAARLVDYFADTPLDAIYSSPYLRTLSTIEPLAKTRGMAIREVPDLGERRVGGWVDDFFAYARRQWEDFTYALDGGESLSEVKERSIAALNPLLKRHAGGCMAIGTHGTALSTVLNHFDETFSYEGFLSIVDIMPLVVRADFRGGEYQAHLLLPDAIPRPR